MDTQVNSLKISQLKALALGLSSEVKSSSVICSGRADVHNTTVSLKIDSVFLAVAGRVKVPESPLRKSCFDKP